MEILLVCSLSCLCLYFVFSVIRLLEKVWWTPVRIQSALRMQGIGGPPFMFLHGNTKEISTMRSQAMSNPMDISHQMLPRIQPHIYSWTKLYGLNFVYWYGSRAQLVVTEPELVKEVLNNKHGSVPKEIIQDYADKLLGKGILVSQGEKWVKLRKLANHAFHAESLKSMIPAMIASTERMVERWRDGGVKEVEVFGEFKVLTSEIISKTAFGSSYLEGKNIFDKLARMGVIVGKNNFKVRFAGFKNFLKTKDDIEADKLDQGIRDSILEMINNREEKVLHGKESYGTDFLGKLLKAHHEDDRTKKISVDELIDECKNFYLAGHETTTSSLTWTVLLLSLHAEWQDRARNEILEFFGQRNPSLDGIGRMKTMGMIVNESLRLYPPVFNLTRQVVKEVKLGELIVPAKTGVILSILALHRNIEIWGEDAHLFRPERFAEEVVKATKSNVSAFLPFGSGPRNCVGLNFAVAEMKIVLSMILQRYKFTLSPTYIHSPVHILTICPKYGLQIVLQEL